MALAARQVERAPLARRTDLPAKTTPRTTPRTASGAAPRTASGTAPRRAAARASGAASPAAERAPLARRGDAAAPATGGVRSRVRVYVRRHDEMAGGERGQTGLQRRTVTVGTRSHSGAAGSTRRARLTAAAYAAAVDRALPGDPFFDVVHGRHTSAVAAASNAVDPLLRADRRGTTLSVVPRQQPRRRGAVRLLGVLCAALVLVMMGAAAFQTQLARRQVELDRLDSDISAARETYEELRRERAELRSPSHLSDVAAERGMVTATEAGFMVLDPEVLAEVQRSAGMIVGAGEVDQEDPLQQFRDVKSVTDGAP